MSPINADVKIINIKRKMNRFKVISKNININNLK